MTIDLLKQAVAATASVIHTIQPGQYDAVTPCAGWTVRDVVNHLVAGNRFFAARAAGQPPDMTLWEGNHLIGGRATATL